MITFVVYQVNESPTHIDVRPDVVGLHLDCAPEVGKSLRESSFGLEGVADVVK